MDEARKLAVRDLRRVLHILSVGSRYCSKEWMLLATLIVEADQNLKISIAQGGGPLPLFAEALEALRLETRNFSDVEFLRGSRAARRQNLDLFKPQPRP